MHRIESWLLIAGAGCLLWVLLVWINAIVLQARARSELHLAPPVHTASSRSPGSLVGMLEVPRLQMSVAGWEGEGEALLRQGAGHLPDTVLPWESGNSAIAGHRDTFFRGLRKLRVGDVIFLDTHEGHLRYQVSALEVVRPDDVSVLDRGDGSGLTLITCYPFRYVGAAPDRFIVRALRINP